MQKSDYDIPGMSWGDIDFGSALKEFTGGPDRKLDKTGDINFIFRGVFPDDAHAVAFSLFVNRCNDCEDSKHKLLAMTLLASWSAVKGNRVHTLLQAVVGQLDGHRPDGHKRRPWDKKDEDKIPESVKD